MRTVVLTAALSAFVALCSGCNNDNLVSGCVSDEQCIEDRGDHFRCSDLFSPKLCVCTSNLACADNFFCNGSGTCVAESGKCVTNDDCDPDLHCSSATGRCVDNVACAGDIECVIGEVCNEVTFRCRLGCREPGDCLLRDVCRCPSNDPNCLIAACLPGLCDDKTFCALKEACVYDDSEDDSVCEEDTRGPYCDNCQIGAGVGLTLCDQPGNYCLVDTSIQGGAGSFCGVDCGDGQLCPNGFSCHFVVILTQALCGRDTDCPSTGASCAGDDDCPGGRCAIPSGQTEGQCAGRCIGSEGGAAGTGFCSCVQDLDCPLDTCDATSRVCGLTRAPCQLNGDQCRGQLSCVNIDGVGGCVIGRNCAPDEGITCAEVRALP